VQGHSASFNQRLLPNLGGDSTPKPRRPAPWGFCRSFHHPRSALGDAIQLPTMQPVYIYPGDSVSLGPPPAGTAAGAGPPPAGTAAGSGPPPPPRPLSWWGNAPHHPTSAPSELRWDRSISVCLK
jgi:hypothetical protein